jgi:hypothetical protein
MQRVWRVGRPVTPNGPGGRSFGAEEQRLLNRPASLRRRTKEKVFHGARGGPRSAGRDWRPASGTRIRFTHGVRFPPPSPAPRPAGEAARREPAPDASPASRRRRGAPAAGSGACGMRGPAGAAPGPWPQVSPGSTHRPRLAEAAPHATRANAAPVDACFSGASRAVQGDSFDRFAVRFSCIVQAPSPGSTARGAP